VRYPAHLAVLVCLAGCSSANNNSQAQWIPVPAADLGAVVARVGEVPIFARQVLAVAVQTGKSLGEALSVLVDECLLAERARQAGFLPASDLDAEVTSALVQRLLEVELEPSLRYETVPDSALRPLYERGHDGFVHGRLVEIGVLGVYTGEPMTGQPRIDRTKTAKELDAFVKAHPPQTLDEFAGIAHAPEWSSRAVVFTRFVQGVDRPLSRAVGVEAAKLHAPGDTTPLVEDESGFFIARYMGERPPENVTFAQARPALLAGYYEHWRQQQFLEFSTKLMRLHRVEAHFDLLPQAQEGR